MDLLHWTGYRQARRLTNHQHPPGLEVLAVGVAVLAGWPTSQPEERVIHRRTGQPVQTLWPDRPHSRAERGVERVSASPHVNRPRRPIIR